MTLEVRLGVSEPAFAIHRSNNVQSETITKMLNTKLDIDGGRDAVEVACGDMNTNRIANRQCLRQINAKEKQSNRRRRESFLRLGAGERERVDFEGEEHERKSAETRKVHTHPQRNYGPN